MSLDALAVQRLLIEDEGRSGRRQFWFYILGAIAFSISAFIMLPLIGVPARAVPLIASLVLIYPTYCVSAKRLQDADIDGHWAIAMSGIAAIDTIFIASGPAAAMTGAAIMLREIWWWVTLANMVVFMIVGLLPGSRGPNRFGPEPL